MPKAHRVAVYELLFKEGVLVAQKDFHDPKHPELENVPNLHVIKTMQSLKSRNLVKEQFAWRHYYWWVVQKIYLVEKLIKKYFSGIWPTKASNTCASTSICPQKSFQQHSSVPHAQRQLVPVPPHVPMDPRAVKTVKLTDAHPDKAQTRRLMSELALVIWNW